MSFFRFTQAPPQHPNPGMEQVADVQVPPELLVLVVDELEVLADPVLVDPVLAVPLVVPWPPAPPAPTVKLPPQPATTMAPIPKAKKVLMVFHIHERSLALKRFSA
jgi:hypothetical protein